MPRLLLLIPNATYRASAFVKAAQKLDIDISIATDQPNALSKFHPVELLTLDFTLPARCATDIKHFASRHGVDAVVPVDDQVTIAAAAIGSALGLPHNPVDATYAARNKHEMKRRLTEDGVPTPRYRLFSVDDDPTGAAAQAMYPCVLKPIMMAASRGVIRADTPGEFVDAFQRVTTIIQRPDAPPAHESRTCVLVEEYVDGWEVAVEGMLTEGDLHILAVFDKPDPLVGPHFPETLYVTPSRLPPDVLRRIEQVTRSAIRAIGLRHGPVHAELRGSGDHIWFIEAAARSIGGYCSRALRFEGGLGLEDLIIGHALSPQHPPPARESSAAGVLMMQAPTRGIFREARGLEEARAIPGIDEVIMTAHPHQVMDPLPEGFLYVGFVFASGNTPEDVETALRRADRTIELCFDDSADP